MPPISRVILRTSIRPNRMAIRLRSREVGVLEVREYHVGVLERGRLEHLEDLIEDALFEQAIAEALARPGGAIELLGVGAHVARAVALRSRIPGPHHAPSARTESVPATARLLLGPVRRRDRAVGASSPEADSGWPHSAPSSRSRDGARE